GGPQRPHRLRGAAGRRPARRLSPERAAEGRRISAPWARGPGLQATPTTKLGEGESRVVHPGTCPPASEPEPDHERTERPAASRHDAVAGFEHHADLAPVRGAPDQ